MSETERVRDLEFTLEFYSPTRALIKFPELQSRPQVAGTTVYAVAECETRKGPFRCILPLDGAKALLERDLAKKLVSAAYDELARVWAEEDT